MWLSLFPAVVVVVPFMTDAQEIARSESPFEEDETTGALAI